VTRSRIGDGSTSVSPAEIMSAQVVNVGSVSGAPFVVMSASAITAGERPPVIVGHMFRLEGSRHQVLKTRMRPHFVAVSPPLLDAHVRARAVPETTASTRVSADRFTRCQSRTSESGPSHDGLLRSAGMIRARAAAAKSTRNAAARGTEIGVMAGMNRGRDAPSLMQFLRRSEPGLRRKLRSYPVRLASRARILHGNGFGSQASGQAPTWDPNQTIRIGNTVVSREDASIESRHSRRQGR
jgi:hypothetical protein